MSKETKNKYLLDDAIEALQPPRPIHNPNPVEISVAPPVNREDLPIANRFKVDDSAFVKDKSKSYTPPASDTVYDGSFKVIKEDCQAFERDVYTCFGVGKFGPTGAWGNFRLDIDFKNNKLLKLTISPPTQRANANASLKSSLQRHLDHEQD